MKDAGLLDVAVKTAPAKTKDMANTLKTDYIIPFECADCGSQWMDNSPRPCNHTDKFERLIEGYNWHPRTQTERDSELRYTDGTPVFIGEDGIIEGNFIDVENRSFPLAWAETVRV